MRGGPLHCLFTQLHSFHSFLSLHTSFFLGDPGHLLITSCPLLSHIASHSRPGTHTLRIERKPGPKEPHAASPGVSHVDPCWSAAPEALAVEERRTWLDEPIVRKPTLPSPCLRLGALSSGPLRTRLVPTAGTGPSGLAHGPQLSPIPAGLEITSLPPGRGARLCPNVTQVAVTAFRQPASC